MFVKIALSSSPRIKNWLLNSPPKKKMGWIKTHRKIRCFFFDGQKIHRFFDLPSSSAMLKSFMPQRTWMANLNQEWVDPREIQSFSPKNEINRAPKKISWNKLQVQNGFTQTLFLTKKNSEILVLPRTSWVDIVFFEGYHIDKKLAGNHLPGLPRNL